MTLKESILFALKFPPLVIPIEYIKLEVQIKTLRRYIVCA